MGTFWALRNFTASIIIQITINISETALKINQKVLRLIHENSALLETFRLTQTERWPPEPKVVGSSPSWRTRLNLIFSIQRLPILEAFVVCTYGQMWTKRDKNRTQNRTQFLGDILGLFCLISCKRKPSRVML